MDIEQVQDYVRRYLTAVYGEKWVYQAPETFRNLVEQWMVHVSNGNTDLAEGCIAEIEGYAAQNRWARSD